MAAISEYPYEKEHDIYTYIRIDLRNNANLSFYIKLQHNSKGFTHIFEVRQHTKLVWTLSDIGVSGKSKTVLPVMAAIFNLPLTPTSKSVRIIPAMLLNPENVGVAFSAILCTS